MKLDRLDSREVLQRLLARRQAALPGSWRGRRGVLLLAVVLSFVLVLAAVHVTQIRVQAEAFAVVFFRSFNSADYASIYRDGTGSDFRQFTDQETFSRNLRNIRSRLGPVEGLDLTEFRYDPGRDAAHLHYAVRFTRDSGRVSLFLKREQGTFVLWRLDVSSEHWNTL